MRRKRLTLAAVVKASLAYEIAAAESRARYLEIETQLGEANARLKALHEQAYRTHIRETEAAAESYRKALGEEKEAAP